jgi:hypothetical protein
MHVRLGELPEPPPALTLTHDETTLTVSWSAAIAGHQFSVFEAPRLEPGTPGEPAPAPARLTPKPTPGTEWTQPVVFGLERCFFVRTAIVSGAVTSEGAPSPVACLMAEDRYPPPAPVNLQAIQEGLVVTLNWTSVEAADLAGYIVLRGDAAGERLEPLMRDPVPDTVYRDTTVEPGATYTYSVYAVDSSPAANVSQQSSRQVITLR